MGQLPLPSQTELCVSVSPLASQAAPMQPVPAMYRRQAPAPLQVPSFPHELGVPIAQPPRASATPVGMDAQVPTEPAMLHAVQVAQVMAWQQTPFVQLPVLHSDERVQVAPTARNPHVPPTQTLGAAQLASLVHEARHDEPLQW